MPSSDVPPPEASRQQDQKHRRLGRSIHISRVVGMGMAGILHAAFLVHIHAQPGWHLFNILVFFLYPHVITFVSRRRRNPSPVYLLGLVIETASVCLFARLFGFDMVYVTVTTSIFLVNACSMGGLRFALVAGGTALLTSLAVSGLTLTDVTQPLTRAHHVALLFLGASYHTLTGVTIYRFSRSNTKARDLARAQARRLQEVQEYLIECTVTPYLSDERLLSTLSDSLGPEELERYRVRLRQRQQLESRGRMLQSAVHDLRNLLQPIVLSAELMSENSEDARWLLQASLHATRILEDLHEHHQEQPAPSPTAVTNVDDTCREILKLLTPLANPDIAISYQRAHPEPWVPLTPTQLHRLVMNICLNGIQVMQGCTAENQRLLSISVDEDSDHNVVISISDQGPGIPKGLLSRIFEPYFTTKATSGGTGLGLATSLALATDVGGTLSVAGTSPDGTTFRVVLPGAPAPR